MISLMSNRKTSIPNLNNGNFTFTDGMPLIIIRVSWLRRINAKFSWNLSFGERAKTGKDASRVPFYISQFYHGRLTYLGIHGILQQLRRSCVCGHERSRA